MGTDRLLWFIAAICFFLGALASMFPAKAGVLNRINWMLAGFGFIALTFVF